MGPAATADLMAKIVAHTPGVRDQDHVRALVDSNPAIPDRTDAILHNGPSPAPAIAESARLLEAAGADFLVMACNTAHAYAPDLERAVRIPLLSMIEATVGDVVELHPGRRAGILATTACLQAGIYQAAFDRAGVDALVLEPEHQRVLMTAIESVKANGRTASAAADVARCIGWLSEAGAQVVVAGCTEVPLVLGEDGALAVVNSTDALARAVVDYAMGVGR